VSISESKNGGKNAAPGQSAEVNVAADIEEALDFLDSEEYQDVGGPNPHTGSATAGINTAQALQQKDPTAIKPQHKRGSRPQKTVREPTKKVSTPLEEEKSKKTGTIWLTMLGIVTLIFLVILFLYKMG